MKLYLLFIIMFLTLEVFCQGNNTLDDTLVIADQYKNKKFNDSIFPKKFYLKLGGGLSSMNVKTWFPVIIESELEYKYSRFFSNSISVGSGKNRDGTISYFEGNIDIGVSPFNLHRCNLKFSGGISYFNYSEFELTYRKVATGDYLKDVYKIYKGDSFGINFNIEYMFSLSKRLIAGCNIFSRFYQNGYSNSGIMLKFGTVL